MTKKLLSIAEVCEATGLSRSFLYKAFGRGALTARKAGRRVVIEAEEVERFVANLPEAPIGRAKRAA